MKSLVSIAITVLGTLGVQASHASSSSMSGSLSGMQPGRIAANSAQVTTSSSGSAGGLHSAQLAALSSLTEDLEENFQLTSGTRFTEAQLKAIRQIPGLSVEETQDFIFLRQMILMDLMKLSEGPLSNVEQQVLGNRVLRFYGYVSRVNHAILEVTVKRGNRFRPGDFQAFSFAVSTLVSAIAIYEGIDNLKYSRLEENDLREDPNQSEEKKSRKLARIQKQRSMTKTRVGFSALWFGIGTYVVGMWGFDQAHASKEVQLSQTQVDTIMAAIAQTEKNIEVLTLLQKVRG